MSSSQHFYPQSGYLCPSFHFGRAMWATIVALACGVVGGAVGLLSLMAPPGLHALHSDAALSNYGYAEELAYDFTVLKASETVGAGIALTIARDAQVRVPPDANIAAWSVEADVSNHCKEESWPFIDTDCLWGTAVQGRYRKRIVFRLKSPWCPGLRYTQGAYNCRSRS